MADFNTPKGGEKSYARPRPPLPEEELIKVLSNQGERPPSFPSGYLEGALHWMGLMEPFKEREHPEWVSSATLQDPGAGRWKTPYIDRLRSALQYFLSLSEPEQSFVTHHIDQGIPYRGDPIDFYRTIVKEHGKMLAVIENEGRGPATGKHPNGTLPLRYTEEVAQIMRSLMNGFSDLPYDKNQRGDF